MTFLLLKVGTSRRERWTIPLPFPPHPKLAKPVLFNFTSETAEDKKKAEREDVPQWEACRIRTWQQARGLEDAQGRSLDPEQRGRVPDILITNYSMLEYM